MNCIWSGWCYCHFIISCFIRIQIGLLFCTNLLMLSGKRSCWMSVADDFLGRVAKQLQTEYHGLSVCPYVTIVSPVKWLNWSRCRLGCGLRWAQGNHALDGVPIPRHEGSVLRAKRGHPDTHGHVQHLIYSKHLSRGQNRYGADADWDVLDGLHIGATWWIRLNSPCLVAASLPPSVTLLWPLRQGHQKVCLEKYLEPFVLWESGCHTRNPCDSIKAHTIVVYLAFFFNLLQIRPFPPIEELWGFWG